MNSHPTLPILADEFVPATVAEMGRFLAENFATQKRVIYPLGGRTALHYGGTTNDPGIGISTSKLTHVIDYPARDMTITVEAGIRIETLSEILRHEKQRLPVDVPIAHRATLGGIIACNVSGARRLGHGTLRDYVIGISALDVQGKEFKAGGRVVKNVAGYDLCKVLTGSLGTLGLISQVTLKVKPIPESNCWIWFGIRNLLDTEKLLVQLLNSATRPVAIEVLDSIAAAEIAAEARVALPHGKSILGVAFEGSSRETAWQIETVTQELDLPYIDEVNIIQEPASQTLWQALAEFEVSAEEPLTFKANLLPSRLVEFLDLASSQEVALQAHAGSGIVIGHLPDRAITAAVAAEILTPLRNFARVGGGNLTILNCPEDWKESLPVFGVPEQSWPLMRRLKEQLDPLDLLNRGRVEFVSCRAARVSTK